MHALYAVISVLLLGVTFVACAPTDVLEEEPSTSSRLKSMSFDDAIAECVDSIPEKCERHLKPHFCYNHFNRQQCCASCQKLREQSDVCPYGNQPITKWRDGRKYNCETYVAQYGTKHCEQSKKFRLKCCKSCEKHNNGQ